MVKYSFLFPFYADEITTELIRLKDGEKIWLPHRKHLYQLLANEYNISHWKISLGYGIAQLIIGASILFLFKEGVFAIISILFLYFSICNLDNRHVLYVDLKTHKTHQIPGYLARLQY